MIANTRLVEGVRSKLGVPYIYGALGRVYSEADIRQFAREYPKTYTQTYLAKTIAKGAGKQGFDCSGLIKYFLWGNPAPDGKFRYDASMDAPADRIYELAREKGGIKTIPELPGVLVWYGGHIGVYAGAGRVIEARGVDYGVVETRLADRPWSGWCKCLWIDYAAAPPTVDECKKIIQERCKFSDPDGVWAVLDKHNHAGDLYRKWAGSY